MEKKYIFYRTFRSSKLTELTPIYLQKADSVDRYLAIIENYENHFYLYINFGE